MNDLNPYAAPALPADERLQLAPLELLPPSTWRRAFFKWLLVCYLCALPSFLWGLGTGNAPVQIAGMLCGIFVFVLAYALAECSEPVRRFRSLPLVNSTLGIGFGCRIAVSLVFPVGMYGDLFLGSISIRLASALGMGVGPGTRDPAPFAFLPHFVTTLIQGVLVNLVLFGFMLLVYSVRRFVLGLPAARPGAAASGSQAADSSPHAEDHSGGK